MILDGIKLSYCIDFILGYQYYLAHGTIRHKYELKDTQRFYEIFKEQNVKNLALISERRIPRSLWKRLTTDYVIPNHAVVEVIKRRKSDYIEIDSDRITYLQKDHKKSNLWISANPQEKLVKIIEHAYQSSLLPSNDELYQRFYTSVKGHLTSDLSFYSDYFDFIDKDQFRVLGAIEAYASISGLERHNALYGMDWLEAPEGVEKNRFFDYTYDFLYQLFRN
jgi:hypothetical protein